MAINPLQIPQYAAPQSLDFSPLANLGKVYKQAANEAASKQTLASLGRGEITHEQAANQLMAVDPQRAMSLANLSNNARDFRFRESEAVRAQQNTEAQLALQRQQIAATQGNTAASQVLARQQFEWQKEQGSRPEIREDVDPATGAKRFFLVNRKDNSVAPLNMPAGPAPAVAAPPIPPGVDPVTYRREMAEGAAKSAITDKNLAEGGNVVLGMVDQLEKKVINPADPRVAKKFGAATGPFVSAAAEASTWDPRKWLYEAGRTQESKAYLDQIKQDAQALNSTMQRELLKGGGAISDSERASINDILGKIVAARSPEDAQALLQNFRGIVRQMFRMPAGQQRSATPSNGLPPLPPGFVVQQ